MQATYKSRTFYLFGPANEYESTKRFVQDLIGTSLKGTEINYKTLGNFGYLQFLIISNKITIN